LGTLELYDSNRREATLGIILGRKDRWGQGYGREAVAAALDYAFGRLGLQKVKLRTFSHNERAQRAFKAAGFKTVGYEELSGGKADVLMEAAREDWHEAGGS
jgi:RimJ/RimL family protein N-acetyltransferase